MTTQRLGETTQTTQPARLDDLRVLFQSADFIVVDKHWDIRIDSKMWYETQTVQAQLGRRFPELADPSTYYGFRFCHQLDFSTSGALCVALNKAAAGRAYRCFRDRRVTKAYIALVRGLVEDETQTVSLSIGKNSTAGQTHMMCPEGTRGCENPKPCQTDLTVLEFGSYDSNPVTKVMLQPLTGRTHQLRVHCSAIGHPIVGDMTYGVDAGDSVDTVDAVDGAPYRMMLHAHLLHLPLEPQPLLVRAGDPFVPSVDGRWRPERVVRTLDKAVEELLERRLEEEEQRRKEEEQERRRRREEETRRRGRKEAKKEESEEQRRRCQEWLSEWAGD